MWSIAVHQLYLILADSAIPNALEEAEIKKHRYLVARRGYVCRGLNQASFIRGMLSYIKRSFSVKTTNTGFQCFSLSPGTWKGRNIWWNKRQSYDGAKPDNTNILSPGQLKEQKSFPSLFFLTSPTWTYNQTQQKWSKAQWNLLLSLALLFPTLLAAFTLQATP